MAETVPEDEFLSQQRPLDHHIPVQEPLFEGVLPQQQRPDVLANWLVPYEYPRDYLILHAMGLHLEVDLRNPVHLVYLLCKLDEMLRELVKDFLTDARNDKIRK